MGKGIKGDFTGFTFNNIHSSTLGLTRVSGGDRYEEDLLPIFQDKVVDGPSTDETYFFGSYFKQKTFTIQVAFDNLSEFQIRKIKQLFGDKQVHELWFDETPYKAYFVKVASAPKIRYICFDKKDNENIRRVYKGEGTLNFVAFSPFAHSRFKYIEQYNYNFSNFPEWLHSSGIRSNKDIDKIIQKKGNERKINLWNGGDISTDFKLNIFFDGLDFISEGYISLNKEKLTINKITKKDDDDGIQINTKLKIIQGIKMVDNDIVVTNNIYNEYIRSGDFFKIPIQNSVLNLKGLYSLDNGRVEIDYPYLYF